MEITMRIPAGAQERFMPDAFTDMLGSTVPVRIEGTTIDGIVTNVEVAATRYEDGGGYADVTIKLPERLDPHIEARFVGDVSIG